MAGDIITLKVLGMSCQHCAGSIKKAVGELNGISSVQVNLEAQKVVVEYDSEKISEDIIRETIEDNGYEVK